MVAKRGVCHRTASLRDEIVSRLTHVAGAIAPGDCGGVTHEMLAQVRSVQLLGEVASLRPGAFAGLSGVLEVHIAGNASLESLPAGVFEGLDAVEKLYVRNNGIRRVEAGAFRGMPKLRMLVLNGNAISTLAPGAFAGLNALEALFMQDNRLEAMPLDELEGLANLGRTDGLRGAGVWHHGNPGYREGMELSATTLTLAPGGSGTYRVRLTTPPDIWIDDGIVHGTVQVVAPAGVTVVPPTLTFTNSDWFRRQTVEVTVARGAAQGALEVRHEVPSWYAGGGPMRSLTVRVAGAAQAQAAALVTGTPAVTGPAAEGAYAQSERIEARVTFDTPVTVDTTGGAPALGLALGGMRRDASYESGSGTDTLVFAHTVSAGDAGAGGLRRRSRTACVSTARPFEARTAPTRCSTTARRQG